MKKSVFVTGAGQGIGRAAAVKFAQNGWRVCATDISGELLSTLENIIGEGHFFAELDVTNEAAVATVLDRATEDSDGKLDCLVNNAGILFDGHFEEIGLQEHCKLLDVNINGVVNCTYAAFDYLRASEKSCVINMSSASSQAGIPTIASYSGSKFFVRGFSEAVSIEWKRHGIHVCSIAPTFVTTKMTQGDRTKIFTNSAITVTAEDVARVLWEAAHKRDVYEWHVENKTSRLQRWMMTYLPRSIVRKELAKSAGYDF